MAYYITYGEIQHYFKEHYMKTGSGMQFPEMVDYLKCQGLLSEEYPADTPEYNMFGHMPDGQFDEILDKMILTLTPALKLSLNVKESSVIPTERDVFIIRHPRYTRPFLHTHNYFEINFVSTGSCTFFFEKETRALCEGELCIIAPGSTHDLYIDDESTVFCIMIRKSTFNTTFFSLLSQKNLLSHFFRTILLGDSHPNYLLFFVKNTDCIKTIIRNALGECQRNDSYSNINCINWMNLLFTTLLRGYSQTLQFYNYQMGSDFSLVLQYIQHNYQTLTLSSLAEFFHYSKPHLCALIKQNTGYTFTELIKRLRTADAISYLTNTNLKVSEIAEQIGYHSADHFSRVFRSIYKMSPQEYRNTHSKMEDAFIPFA